MAEFRKTLKTHRRAAGVTEPLAPLRELALIYGVNHTTIFRQLQTAEKEGVLWKASNGRYYLSEARFAVEKPRPVACLFRKIENWSLLYQEFMEGIAERCEAIGIGSLLWHDDALVRHADFRHPPVFADVPHQIQSLRRFIAQNENAVGGAILDHLWTDEAVATLPDEWRKNTVRMGRPSPGGIPSVAPDYAGAAHLALTHLFASGYQAIQPVQPFPGDADIEHSLDSFLAAASKAGAGAFLHPPKSAADPKARASLIRLLGRATARTALVFPEDNTARIFQEEATELAIPGKIGIITLQGTRGAAAADLTHVRTNYRALGRAAVEAALNLPARESVEAPHLVPGKSTSSR